MPAILLVFTKILRLTCLRHMSNYLGHFYWSEICPARHYVKLSNPVFSVMSKACLLLRWLWVKSDCSTKCDNIIVLKLKECCHVTVYSRNLTLQVVGEKHCKQLKNISCEWHNDTSTLRYSDHYYNYIKKGKPYFYLLQFWCLSQHALFTFFNRKESTKPN